MYLLTFFDFSDILSLANLIKEIEKCIFKLEKDDRVYNLIDQVFKNSEKLKKKHMSNKTDWAKSPFPEE